MSVWASLFWDAPFWVAGFVFIVSSGLMTWGLWQLLSAKFRAHPQHVTAVSTGTVERRFAGAESPAVAATTPPSTPKTNMTPIPPVSVSVPSPGQPKSPDLTALMTVVEERMSDFLKRISALERKAEVPAAAAPNLNINPLLERLEELAGEMGKIKLFLADAPPPVDTTEIIRRLTALEKFVSTIPAPTPQIDMTPLLNRLAQVDQEITKVKLFLADLPAVSGASDKSSDEKFSAMAKKVDALQSILESLTVETEAAKPS